MSHLLSKYLPYALLMYMLIRSVNKPIYLLGIPFLIFFKYCIFFENVKLFNIPGSINKDVLFLAWLFIIWVIFSSRSFFQIGYKRIPFSNYIGLSKASLFIYGLIIISIIGLFFVLNEYFLITDVFSEFFAMISLFVGYFIIKDIIKYTDPESLKNFLYTIVIINSIASALYILHQGLHVTLYEAPWAKFEPQEELFGGQFITREFWCMPILWFFSIGYLIVFRKERILINIALLTINFLAIFVSFTRSSLGIGLVVIFMYFILIAYKKRNISSLIKSVSVVVLIAFTLFFALNYFFPKKVDYFASRVNELKANRKNQESNDLIFRFAMSGEIIHKMKPEKRIAGMGPVTELQVGWVEDMKAITADMAWTGVIFRWGYLGLSFFILLYITSVIKAFKLFMQNNGIISQLALLMLLTIISQILESFVSATFMTSDRFAMGLWYFGVLSALVGFDKKYQHQFSINEEYQLS